MRTPRLRYRRLSVELIFEPRDLWIGVFWDRLALLVNVYVCIVPMLPLRFVWWTGKEFPRRWAVIHSTVIRVPIGQER